tara:strand:- start:145 stop:354 length:210 start_codon:yes stop_codon:yes gene_type:complete
MLVVKNILRWLFPKQMKSTTLEKTEDHEYYEKYIDHQMQEHIDDNEMLRWEGEEVPLHELKKGKKNDSN